MHARAAPTAHTAQQERGGASADARSIQAAEPARSASGTDTSAHPHSTQNIGLYPATETHLAHANADANARRAWPAGAWSKNT